MKKKILSVVVVALMSMFLMTGCSFNFLNLFDNTNNYGTSSIYTQPSVIETEASLEQRLKQIGQDYVDAVVTVFVVDINNNEVSFGSGVGVYEGGFIATNYHVIETVVEDSQYSLKVYYNEGEIAYDAEILWYQMNFDLAIIKSENPNLPFVEMQDRFIAANEEDMLYALETVVAIGTPLDFSLQNTVTVGNVASANGRVSYSNYNVYEDLIQHTSPINHGNSGGALFDSYGKLIGLNTLGNDDANSIFFAVSIYPIILVLDKVVYAYENSQTYKTPKIGISAYDMYQAMYDDEINFNEDGMLVLSVPIDGPSFGKLFVNDIIKAISVDGVNYTVDLRNDLLYALLKADSGDVVSVTYERNNTNHTVNITLA